MNNRKRKNNGGTAVGIGIAALLVILSAIDSGDEGGLILGIIIIAALIIVAISAYKKKKSSSNDDKAQPEERESAAPAGEKSFSKRMTELMHDNIDDCKDDHEHAETVFRGTAEERRAAQLKDFLRSGLIERDEYDILMKKYGLK